MVNAHQRTLNTKCAKKAVVDEFQHIIELTLDFDVEV